MQKSKPTLQKASNGESQMTERFTLKEDGIHDKETDRVFQLDKNLLRLLNTLDKMLKQYMVKSYAQDQEIQKLLNKEVMRE